MRAIALSYVPSVAAFLAAVLFASAYAQSASERVSIPGAIDFELLDGVTLEGDCASPYARGAPSVCLLASAVRIGVAREGYVQLAIAQGWGEPHEHVRGQIRIANFAKPVSGSDCPARLSIIVFPGAALAVNDAANQVDRIALLTSEGPLCEPLPWSESLQ